MKTNIHVLALNETKIGPTLPDTIFEVDGYKLIRKDRSPRGGGIAFYLRDSLNYILRQDLPIHSLELACIEIRPQKSRPFIIISWYRPPNSHVSCFEMLENVLSFLDKEGKEIILLGDTNCNFSPETSEKDSNAKNLHSIYNPFNFKQIINEPTRECLFSRTVIDHITTNLQRNILQSGVIKVSMSDHYMAYCVRKFNGSLTRDHKAIKMRNMENFSKSAFLADVSRICWEVIIMPCHGVDERVRKWTSVFYTLVEKHAPYRELRVSERYCTWVTLQLKNVIKKRDNLKRNAIKNNSTTQMTAYKTLRKQANTLNRELKKQYFAEKIAKEKGNMKGTWKTVNQLVSKSSTIDLYE